MVEWVACESQERHRSRCGAPQLAKACARLAGPGRRAPLTSTSFCAVMAGLIDWVQRSRYDACMSDMIVIFGGLALGEALASADQNAGFNWDLLLMLSLLMLALSLLVRYMIKHSD